jgi:CheY-like chemotaxis protein
MREQTGEICVRVESFTQQIFSQKNGFSLRPGCYARIVFSDTGHGMSASTKNRIFEPFFTTKPVGEGTGLGLAVVHGIMQSHEGAIFVSSEVGKGSKFELYFPTASASADALSPHEVASTVSEGAGQIILYLDDDESQLFMFKRMLEWWGYRVIAYREQLEAIEAVRNGEISFDLMITDYKMPGISGLEVARAVRDVRPNLPVLMVSGYINDHLRSQATAAGVRELFSKPHEEEDLRDAIQELLPPPPEAIHPS